MRPRPRKTGLGPFDQLSRRSKQKDQHPARTERTSRALAEELSQREEQIGRDLRIEPRAASSGDGGVVLFLAVVCFIYMEEIMEETAPRTLLECWLDTIRPWQSVFAQNRTWVRAARQALGSLLVLGRATVSRILWTTGREQKSWSGEYFLHSRAAWEPHALFTPLLKEGLAFCPGKVSSA